MRYRFFVSAFMALFVVAFATSVSALSIDQVHHPRDTDEWVSDMAQLMRVADLRDLNRSLDRLEKETGAEVAVVTVPTISGATSVRQYGRNLFNRWGIGKRGEDNGVLILLDMDQRRLEIIVGRGLENVLDRRWLDSMQDREMVPYFVDDRFAQGLIQGVEAIDQRLRQAPEQAPGEAEAPAAAPASDGDGQGGGLGIIVIGGIFLLIFGGIVVAAIRNRKSYTEVTGEVAQEMLAKAPAGPLDPTQFQVMQAEQDGSYQIRLRTSSRAGGRIRQCPQCSNRTLEVFPMGAAGSPMGMGAGMGQGMGAAMGQAPMPGTPQYNQARDELVRGGLSTQEAEAVLAQRQRDSMGQGMQNQMGVGGMNHQGMRGQSQARGQMGPGGSGMMQRQCHYCGYQDTRQDRSGGSGGRAGARRGRVGQAGGDDFGGGRAGGKGSGSNF